MVRCVVVVWSTFEWCFVCVCVCGCYACVSVKSAQCSMLLTQKWPYSVDLQVRHQKHINYEMSNAKDSKWKRWSERDGMTRNKIEYTLILIEPHHCDVSHHHRFIAHWMAVTRAFIDAHAFCRTGINIHGNDGEICGRVKCIWCLKSFSLEHPHVNQFLDAIHLFDGLIFDSSYFDSDCPSRNATAWKSKNLPLLHLYTLFFLGFVVLLVFSL